MRLLQLPVEEQFREVGAQHVQRANRMERGDQIGTVADRARIGRMHRPNQRQFPCLLLLSDHLRVHGLPVSVPQFAGNLAVPRPPLCESTNRQKPGKMSVYSRNLVCTVSGILCRVFVDFGGSRSEGRTNGNYTGKAVQQLECGRRFRRCNWGHLTQPNDPNRQRGFGQSSNPNPSDPAVD